MEDFQMLFMVKGRKTWNYNSIFAIAIWKLEHTQLSFKLGLKHTQKKEFFLQHIVSTQHMHAQWNSLPEDTLKPRRLHAF